MPHHREKNIILVSIFSMVILVIGTGLYELESMPKDELLVSSLSIFALIIGYSHKEKFGFIKSKILLGFILFNLFFIIHISFLPPYNLELKTYTTHVITLGTFLAAYNISSQMLSPNFHIGAIHKQDLVLLISLTALAIILSTQLWQIFNGSVSILLRPGGLLNPNITAALSLCFMFTAIKISRPQHSASLYIALLLSTCIILLTQSRSATLALAAYTFYVFIKKENIKLITSILIFIFILAIVSTIGPDTLTDLSKSIMSRFKGDYSSIHRLLLLQQGWSAFLEAPIWGNGYRHLASITSVSTHNEILEALTNFGLSGLIIISLAFSYLYLPFSTIFCIACVLPTLIFTHNFFDTYALQAAIGAALAVDRYKPTETFKNI